MHVLKHETLPVHSQNDIVAVRQRVRQWAIALGLGLIDQTKVVTAASELARNTLDYGGGGKLNLENVQNENMQFGLRLTFADEGPGIADLNLALTDGYTSGGGLGLGLSGARRLMSEFSIESEVGKGTRVSVTKWK